ncbi:hypothetical protein FXF53_22960 [Micromonospora sp. WP24]|uniref:hypothetical protein n=1 Tax=Micromonospora sp. WP24 TaxID=2604469 RepID=UPI0011D4E532|nr:hypothetical protein [Micromonospora sp. WP24]TYB96110.1 hypothetical protein FXF53_22960 [Micromonospora sp. WP24]
MFAPVVAVGFLVLGLVLNAATIIYDLTRPDFGYDLSPQEAANGNGLADLGLIVVAQLSSALSGLAVAGLLPAMVGLVRGRPWAHVTTCVVAAPIALCCGPALIKSQDFSAGQPDSLTPWRTSAPSWVVLGDTLGPPLLVGAAIVVLVLLFVPAVHRRFYRPGQRGLRQDARGNHPSGLLRQRLTTRTKPLVIPSVGTSADRQESS